MTRSPRYIIPALCLFLATGVAYGSAPHVITSFESAEELLAIMPGSARVPVALSTEEATHGGGSARVSFPPYNPRGGNWPSVALALGKTVSAVTDWTDYRRVELDVTNPADAKREFGVSFRDQDERSAAYSYWPLPPRGKITISFETGRLAEAIDCSRMHSILFWQRLHVRRPKDRTEFLVDYVRLMPKTLDEASVQVWLTEPHFRNGLYASQPTRTIRAEIQLDLPKAAAGGQAIAMLVGPTGEAVGQVPLKTDGKVQTVSFPRPETQPGSELTLRVQLSSATGEKLYERGVPIPVLTAGTDEVTVDDQNRLIVSGCPFFPIGIYNAPVDDLGLLARMGLNCAGPYLTATPEYVAEAKKHGLRLIGNAPQEDADWVRQAAESGQFLAYYVYDEPAPDRADELRQRCLDLAKMDPYHPTCGCNNLHHDYYTDVADITMVDAYPHPGKFDVIVRRMQAAVRAMKGRRPVWYIPQTFARIGYMHAGTTLENSREPTFDELRAATWLGIALGARGVVYYSHCIQTFRIRHGFPILWRALGHTVAELRALHDVLLWPQVAIESSDPNVHAGGFAHDGKLLVIAVNAGPEAATATLSLPTPVGDAVHVLGEGRRVTCTDGKVTDELGPKTAHLYTTWPLASPIDAPSVRAELGELRAAHNDRLKHNVALFYRGATLEASWGFPKDVRGYPWLRMLDGYRGTTWPLGALGLLRGRHRFPPAMRGPDRWLEVHLPEAQKLDRAVVITSHSDYELAVPAGDEWRKIAPIREKRTGEYGRPTLTRTFSLDGITSDRVRLLLPRPPSGETREIYYEIEVYRAPEL